MRDPVVENLILDLLQWLAAADRTYEQVMNAWRSSCPRFPVWEEANDRGLIVGEHVKGRNLIRVSPLGRSVLDRCSPQTSAQLPSVERLE